MRKKKGFFQTLKENFEEAKEGMIKDMRRWGREVGQAEAEGRKPDVTKVLFAKDDDPLDNEHELLQELKEAHEELQDE